jgi:hypothetical protein
MRLCLVLDNKAGAGVNISFLDLDGHDAGCELFIARPSFLSTGHWGLLVLEFAQLLQILEPESFII